MKNPFKKEHNLEHLRHTFAHLLAAAVKELYPDAKPTIGPSVENGFYYDFDFAGATISNDDLPKIEKKMRELLPNWKEFESKTVTSDEARTYFKKNPYKVELINDLEKEGATITLYTSGGFTDLCRGGHAEHPAKELSPEAFTLSTVAGAYWRGDEKNQQLTRIYGLAFDTKKELEEYQTQLEEAKKRDHRKLGKELDLFTFSELVGPGLPLFLPRGQILKSELEQYIFEEKKKLGYQFVHIPHIAKTALYEKSGHLGKYDAMMPIMKDANGDEYVLKAMNCPHHFCIYNDSPRSYKELPLRIAENTVVYRNEKSGELSGLLRVKNLTQDDTHHFVRHDQIQSEIELIIGLMERIYNVFGFSEYKVGISVRDPKHKEQYFGGDALWDKAENILIEAVKKWGAEYVIEEGEAAFYGPKIDIQLRDSIGRYWQLTTVQMDFTQPENFNMRYTGEDGDEHPVAVLHVAILGSVERFLGILIEHYAGNFPFWLSPVQVEVLPIGEGHLAYAEDIVKGLEMHGFRAHLDNSAETLGKKIRNWKLSKTPYALVIGDQEVEKKEVSLESRDDGKIGSLSLEALIERFAGEKNPTSIKK